MWNEFLKENYEMTDEEFQKLKETEYYTARIIEREFESAYKEYLWYDTNEYNQDDWYRF